MAGDVDARAKKILFNTFWTSKGWIDDPDRSVSASDRAYAMQHGMMFDPRTIEHDALVDEVLRLTASIDLAGVSGAFLASLSTRRLDLRSALASYALAGALRPHRWSGGQLTCAVCDGCRRYRDAHVR